MGYYERKRSYQKDHFLLTFRKEWSLLARKVKIESKFQRGLKEDILERFPGSKVFKIEHSQGYPDLLILYGKHWATLECKRESDSHRQPNQPYYVDEMNAMSFSRFVYPENKEEVLDDLQSAFET